jgi:ABC-2 type transport system ATP-binding protein
MQEWRRSIGAVLEELSLFEYLTVREHLVLTGRLAGLDAGETERRVEELLDFFDLADHAGTVASEASQGTRKKLAFALGLVHSPSLLLLDEAFNGIDAVTVSRVKGLLSRLAGRGVTVIMSSHILDSAQTVIQRCVIVDRGALILDASMESILRAGRSLEQVYTEAISGASRPLPELSWV